MTWRQWIYSRIPFLVGFFGFDHPPRRRMSCTGERVVWENGVRRLEDIDPRYDENR